MDKIRVAVTGASGRMGMEVVRTVLDQPDMELVLAVDRNRHGEDIGTVIGRNPIDIQVQPRLLSKLLEETKPEVLVDFTVAMIAPEHALTAIEHGVRPVIGTSGIGKNSITDIRLACSEHNTGALLVPNFAIGAVLMMSFAKQAARYFPDAEIIELHHDGKIDAPSQTAMRTAEVIAGSRQGSARDFSGEQLKLEGARGAEFGQVKIHSIRLSGLLAHQEVIFGGVGEVLTIRHDSLDRKSFMPGVMLAIRKVREIEGLVVGLDQVL